jgi:hypothetical protein
MKIVTQLMRRLCRRAQVEETVECWKVQAFLLPCVTQGEEYAYEPRTFTSGRVARAAVTGLYASFGPGHVRVDLYPIDPVTGEKLNSA